MGGTGTGQEDRKHRAEEPLVLRHSLVILLSGVVLAAVAFGIAFSLTGGPTFRPRFEVGLQAATGVAALTAGLLTWGRLELSRREHHLAVTAEDHRFTTEQRRLDEVAAEQRLARDRDLTDRYGRAIELLGSPDLLVRVGGIYALERFALDAVARPDEQRDVDWRMALGLLATMAMHISAEARKVAGSSPEDGRSGDSDLMETPVTVAQAVRVLGRFRQRSRRSDLDIRHTLTGVVLKGADLIGHDLRGSVLTDADLRDADLSGSTLRDAIFQGADLSGAIVRGADLVGARLDQANLRQATLRDADLTGSRLHQAVLDNADLGTAILRGANLHGSQAKGAMFEGADLRDATLASAELDGATLRGAILRGVKASGAHLNDANLRDADLRGANLRQAVLRGALLETADATGANLGRAILQGARLHGAVLDGADLRGADLRRADLTDASIVGTDLGGASMNTTTDVIGAHFDHTTKWPDGFTPPSRRSPPRSLPPGS